MKQTPLLIATLFFCVGSASAQQAGYSIDNFDFRNGVKTVEPVAPQPVSSPGKRRSRSKNSTAANAAAPAASSPLVIPTVMTSGLSVTAPVENVGALRGYTTGSPEIDGYLIESGTSNGVDPLLLYSVMHQESSFKSRAISPP